MVVLSKLKIQQYCKTEYTQIIEMSRVSQKILVSTNFHLFFQNYQNQGQLTEGKKEEVRREEDKGNQNFCASTESNL